MLQSRKFMHIFNTNLGIDQFLLLGQNADQLNNAVIMLVWAVDDKCYLFDKLFLTSKSVFRLAREQLDEVDKKNLIIQLLDNAYPPNLIKALLN